MGNWPFVLAAYTLVFGVLVAYWWRVECRIRVLERVVKSRPPGPRP
jgi:hypothetical protein